MASVNQKTQRDFSRKFAAVRIHLDKSTQLTTKINSHFLCHVQTDKRLITLAEVFENSDLTQQHIFHKSCEYISYKNASPSLSHNKSWCKMNLNDNHMLTGQFQCGMDFYETSLENNQDETLWKWSINGPKKKHEIKIFLQDSCYLLEQLIDL